MLAGSEPQVNILEEVNSVAGNYQSRIWSHQTPTCSNCSRYSKIPLYRQETQTMMVAVCNQKSIAAVYHYYGQDVLMVCEWVLKRKALHDKGYIRWDISSTMWGTQESWAHSQPSFCAAEQIHSKYHQTNFDAGRLFEKVNLGLADEEKCTFWRCSLPLVRKTSRMVVLSM